MVIGQYGVLTPDEARNLARKHLAAAAAGKDPSADRRALRSGMTVNEVCDWYLDQATSGRLLGRSRKPIKDSIRSAVGGRFCVTRSVVHSVRRRARA